MEAEELVVLYDYDYDYKEKKVSIRRDEKLKLLQRTNQHWWKVVRPGVNKAFFVPAQYVQVVSVPAAADTNSNLTVSPDVSIDQSASSAPSSPQIVGTECCSRKNSNSSEKKHQEQNSSLLCKIKRTDSTRASKKAMKVKNWSASLEELSKQIRFPGILPEGEEMVSNIMSQSMIVTDGEAGIEGGACDSERESVGGGSTSQSSKNKNKPVPLPRKCVSDSCSGGDSLVYAQKETSVSSAPLMTPKPIPKARSKYLISDGISGNKSSGGSSEFLTATSSEEHLGMDNYKEESVLVRRSRFEGEPESTNGMKTKSLSGSSPVRMIEEGTKPRKPSHEEVAVRRISENWSEYVTTEKRCYYYNSLTGATSWKPPRVNSLQNKNECSYENSNSSLTFDLEIENNNEGPPSILREEESGPKNNGTEVPIPQGWSYVYDDTLCHAYYVNDLTGVRWLSSQDPEGKIYYYEENSTKSSWFLPVPGISLHDDSSSTPLSKSTTSDSLEGREVSPGKGGPMPDVVTTLPPPYIGSPTTVKKRHSAGEVADRIKARSMLIIPESRKPECSRVGSLPRGHQKTIWNFSKDEESWITVIREGPLSRTKITENGKKVRKNWSTVYVVLTEEHLSLFKDEKSFGSKKSEMEIELSGSTVDWSVDKTSRKHVFQLNTSTDLQILFQADDPESTRIWIEDIQDVIKRQPVRELLRLRSTSPDPYMENSVVGEKKSSRLGRAKSTKLKISGSVETLTSEEKNKIRAQLKKFFNRRPGRESLVKKGIYKDEAVFGCLLEKLCSREMKSVPNFVKECIAAIEGKDENMKTDGIYRASGNLSQVQKIRFQVDQNNLTCLYHEDDVHVLAGALKLFFREMREPLIPSDLFAEALGATNLHTKKEQIVKFREIMGKLGKPNRATLHLLLKHLLRVSEFSEYNRMLIPNLAIVFGPTLMWPAHESTNMALDLMRQNFVIEALLLDFDLIFEKR